MRDPSSHSHRSHQPQTPARGTRTAFYEPPSSTRSVSSLLSSLSSLSLSQHNNSRGRLRLDPLPANTGVSNAVLLDPYVALPSEDGAIAPILAALTAFNAASAHSHWMQLEAVGNKEHDPRYYIKETSRRLQAYYQVTDVIYQLVRLCPAHSCDMLTDSFTRHAS